MKRKSRLTSDERRAAILEAVVPLFAEKGFHRVRTKELAAAAGVSEALLYKHFPSKEALYLEIQKHVHGVREEEPAIRKFTALAPSTEKLVLGFHLFISHMLLHTDAKQMTLPRLMLTSLLDDGAFARATLARFRRDWFPLFRESYEAARKSGDIRGSAAKADLAVWFAHHLAFAGKTLMLPGSIVGYGVPRKELAAEAVRFTLRGIGLKEAAIRRYHDRRRIDRLLR